MGTDWDWRSQFWRVERGRGHRRGVYPPPFKVKMVEPIRLLPELERKRRLAEAHYNVFRLASQDVFIDLLTDSGTGAMSDRQWSAMLLGDEAYAGSRSWQRLRSVLEELTGMEYVFPVHQGRAAERVLFQAMDVRGKVFLSNGFFDTTRANLEVRGARPVDLPEGKHPVFAGNLDVERARAYFRGVDSASRVGGILLTLTNNTYGGTPVSWENIQAARRLADEAGVPLLMDIARLAENTYFIARHELKGEAPWTIACRICRQADIILMSGKKDGLVNMGGFLAVRDASLAERCQYELILGEGYIHYGGLSGREMEAFAVGLRESFDLAYLEYRIQQVHNLGWALKAVGMPVAEPFGGHAIYVDALALYRSVVPRGLLPAAVLTCMFYVVGGIRVSDLGSLAFGRFDEEGNLVEPAPNEYVRLALPRRVYTEEHYAYVVEVAQEIVAREPLWKGFRVVWAPAHLRHFTARLAPVASSGRGTGVVRRAGNSGK